MPTDQPGSVRIGTWNLKLCPPPDLERGSALRTWMDSQDAQLWLLTEVHPDWTSPEGFVLSPPRSLDPDKPKRWAGISASHSLTEVTGPQDHPGDEGLALARMAVAGTSVLVACSVLPWRASGRYWHGLPTGQPEQYVTCSTATSPGSPRRASQASSWSGVATSTRNSCRRTGPVRTTVRRRCGGPSPTSG
ncbi:hypothetical protein [Geodermatophilus amargosae]|uniref:hypothetical protein n=1 Tax=Geodermatophilus amargosae TaxID=1296565 RepID=UPI0034DFFBBC